MKYLFITDITPFFPLLDFDINGINIDLHNDFDFVQVKNDYKSIEFYFKKATNNGRYHEQNAVLIFSNLVENNIEFLTKNNQMGDLQTLTNFAKGQLSPPHKFSQDKSIKYFFIDFFNGSLIDIFCKEAIILLW